MFKRNYKYYVSFYFELDDCDAKFGSAIVKLNFKIKKEENLDNIITNLVEIISKEYKRKCNFLCIQNWRKLK